MHALRQFWNTCSVIQKRWLTALVALLALSGGTALGMALHGAGSGTSASVWQSPQELFAARSPGARLSGALSWVKQRLAGPQQGRSRAPALPLDRTLAAPIAPPVVALAPAPDLLLGAPAAFDAPLPEVLAWAPAVAVPDRGGGYLVLAQPTGAGAPRQNPPIPPTQPAAVPEPETWMMVIIGVGAVGVGLRRSRRTAARSGAVEPA